MNAHSSYLAHLLSQSEGLLFHVLYVVLGLRVQSGGPFVGLKYLGGSVALCENQCTCTEIRGRSGRATQCFFELWI